MAVHRDPTGMTAAQAKRESELLFTKHPTLRSVYGDSVMSASVYRCTGQVMYAGRKTTRGCGHTRHLQPCPGGPMVYQISRQYSIFNVIEARAESWRAAIDQILKQRAEEAIKFEAYRAERDAAKKAKRKRRRAS